MPVVQRALRPARYVRIAQGSCRVGLPRIAQHDVVPKAVVPCLRQLLEDTDCRCAFAGVVNSCQAPVVGFSDCGQNGFPVVVTSRRGYRPLDQILGVVDEDSGRLARSQPYDSSTRGIASRRRYMRELHRLRVGEQCVTIDTREDDRIVRECAGERVVGRKLLGGPPVLIPAPAEDPLAGRNIFGSRFHSIDHLIVRCRSGEINPLQRVTQTQQVCVRVDDSRNDCRPSQIDDLGGSSGPCFCLCVGSEEEDTSGVNSKCGSDRSCAVDGVNASVCENEIGRRLRCERCRCERGNRKIG